MLFAQKAVGAFQQVLEFGDVGAQIGQTRSSFDSLANSLGQGPALMNELTAATRGTVSELDLMRSTSTLLMGTSGDLGRQLADNAPQLAAIAQAAHDLNPTLGTTAENYDRLSRGIKKAEPELLDELGILVNLTQVYKDYAASHGITVTAMDKTMKTEAMLNAVLKQGNTLIEQAAQVNTSAATSIDRMQASLDNMGNAAKERAAPAIAGMADAITNMLTPAQQLTANLTKSETAARASSQTYTEYSSAVKEAAQASGLLVLENGNLVDAHMNLVQSGYMLSASEWQVAKTMGAVYNSASLLSGGLSTLDAKAQGFGNSLGTVDGGLSMLGETFPAVTEAVGASEQAITTYGDRLTALAGYYAEVEAAEQQRIASAGLLAGIQGQLGDATASYSATLEQLTDQEAQLTAAMVDLQERGYAPTSEKMQELNEALQANQAAQATALENLQNLTAEMLYQQAAAGLDTQAALDLARTMGVLSESDYAAATAVQTLREEFDRNNDQMIDATEAASGYNAAIDLTTRAIQSLQSKNLPVTLQSIAKEMETLSKADASEEMTGTAEAASEGADPLADFAAAAADAGESSSDSASSIEDQNKALEQVQSAANRATSGITSAGNAARNATPALRGAANAAEDLSDALRSIRSSTSISVTTSGFPQAISWVNQLGSALDSLPSSIDVSIHLSASAGSSSSTSAPVSAYESPAATAAPAVVNETYNIYDPLAAVMLIENKRAATLARLEALMNG